MGLIFSEIIDISVEVSNDTEVFSGDTPCELNSDYDISSGVTLSEIRMNLHTGTHIDAPAHFFKGAERIFDYNINDFMLKVAVCSVRGMAVSIDDINSLSLCDDVKGVLFKRCASGSEAFYIEPDAGELLSQRGLKITGIESLSVDRYSLEECPVHKALLSSGCCILECIDLKEVKDGIYTLIAFPLKMKAPDAAPVRAILLKN